MCSMSSVVGCSKVRYDRDQLYDYFKFYFPVQMFVKFTISRVCALARELDPGLTLKAFYRNFSDENGSTA